MKEGTKEGSSTCLSLEESQKNTTDQESDVEARTEGNISSVYGSVT